MITAAHNPFRVECIHALDYHFDDLSWDDFINRLHRMRWRAAIAGPHGSGKTTLLATLAHKLRERGMNIVELFVNRDHGRALPPTWRDADRDAIILADGYDVLHAAARWRVRRRFDRLIVTSHRRCALPVAHCCRTRAEVLSRLVCELTDRPLPADEAASLLHHHRGNMRDALRTLYDRAASRHV